MIYVASLVSSKLNNQQVSVALKRSTWELIKKNCSMISMKQQRIYMYHINHFQCGGGVGCAALGGGDGGGRGRAG